MKIRFSGFELDEERFLLERAGERVPLRPKVFDLLVRLVRHRARVVRREELVEELWNGTAVGTGSLSGLVNELRGALAEGGLAVSSIRTVHARGYQFVAPVEEVTVDRLEAHPPAIPNETDSVASTSAATSAPTPARVCALIEQVAEHGTRGILIAPPRPQDSSGDPRGLASELEGLLAGAEAEGFESCLLSMPDESMATPGRIARQLVDAMVGCRGREAVRLALPLPARVWFEDQGHERVVGGFAQSSLAPPGGMGSVARLLSELARRRPLVCVLDGIDRAGQDFARDLGNLLERLAADPVLWLGTVRGGNTPRSGAAVRALEEEAGFVRWSRSDAGLQELVDRFGRLGHAPLPAALHEALNSALASHPRGEAAAVCEIADWLDGPRCGDITSLRPSRTMHRVEPRAGSRSAAWADSSARPTREARRVATESVRSRGCGENDAH